MFECEFRLESHMTQMIVFISLLNKNTLAGYTCTVKPRYNAPRYNADRL